MEKGNDKKKNPQRAKKILTRVLGLPLVYAGVTVLVGSYLLGWSHINALLFTGLGLVLAGVASYIIMSKRESRY